MSDLKYATKIKGQKVNSGTAYPPVSEWLISGFAGFLIVGLVAFLNSNVFPAYIIPFGASAVLVFAAPAAPFSQPRNVIGGHFIAGVAGLAVTSLVRDINFFVENGWLALALSNGLAIGAMVALKAIHPPAGATALLPWTFEAMRNLTWLFAPVLLGSVIIVLVGVIYNNVWSKRHYPAFWW